MAKRLSNIELIQVHEFIKEHRGLFDGKKWTYKDAANYVNKQLKLIASPKSVKEIMDALNINFVPRERPYSKVNYMQLTAVTRVLLDNVVALNKELGRDTPEELLKFQDLFREKTNQQD